MKNIELKDYINILSGFAFKSSLFSNDSSKIPLIRIRDIKRGFSETFYDGEYDDKYVILRDDMLVGMDGEFNVEYWKGIPSLLNQRVCKIEIIDDNKLYKRYLYYIIKGKLKEIEDKTSFVTVKHLSINDINKIQIPLPPLATQKAIAEKLDKADALRKKDQELLKQYDELAQSIFIEMFGDPVQNEKGWEKIQLEDLGELSSGSTPSREIDSYFNGDIPWIKTTEVKNEYIHDSLEKISLEALKNSSCKIYPKESLIVAMYGQGKTRGQVGYLKLDATTNQACCVIQIQKDISNIFIFETLKMLYEDLRELGRGGNQPNLNVGILKKYKIIIPPLELQNQFAEKIKNIEAQKELVKKQAEESENLFQALLQESFNFK